LSFHAIIVKLVPGTNSMGPPIVTGKGRKRANFNQQLTVMLHTTWNCILGINRRSLVKSFYLDRYSW
jgi:hypothetical protein